MPLSRDDFLRWREDRVTQWVMRAHRAAAEDHKARWVDISWEAGAANQPLLSELRTRADAYLAICETDYEGYCEKLGEQPNEE